MLKLKSSLWVGIFALGMMVAPAYGDSMGVPVTGMGSTTPVGCVMDTSCYDPATGEITFFIPLSDAASGTFGVGGVGTSPDSVTGSNNTGYLDMFLYFGPSAAGSTLTVLATDLDLSGVNDPNSATVSLLESLQFFDKDGNFIAEVSAISGAGCPSSVTCSGDSTSQTLVFDLAGLGVLVDGEFAVKFHFETDVTLPDGKTGTNTPESIIATLGGATSVPEPTTLTLLAAGLLGFGVFRTRFKG